jgi:hypothetical protein
MGARLRVQVLPQVDHSERSKAQLHEGDRCGEGARSESASRMDQNQNQNQNQNRTGFVRACCVRRLCHYRRPGYVMELDA